MNTEALKKLGLTQEQIDAIMAENGKDIKAEQDKAEGLKKERDSLQSQLSEANETIKGYKDMDIDAIKKSAGDWEDKYKASVKELEDMRFDNLLDKGLTGSGAYDADIVKKLLDREALIVKDGKLEGLDKQLAHMQEKRPYLFEPKKPETQEQPAGDKPTGAGFQSFVPPASGDGASGKSNHPRVCGEYKDDLLHREQQAGSPPRVRGIRWHDQRRVRCGGITPTCAGNTGMFFLGCAAFRDHPRVCGEYLKRQ